MYAIKIYATRLKKRFEETYILLISGKSLFAIGLYRADCTTAPTPHSQSEMIDKNCVTDDTTPLILEP